MLALTMSPYQISGESRQTVFISIKYLTASEVKQQNLTTNQLFVGNNSCIRDDIRLTCFQDSKLIP